MANVHLSFKMSSSSNISRIYISKCSSFDILYFSLRAVYTWDFAHCDCHPRVCKKLITVYAARYLLMIRCSLSSTLSSVKHILQDVNRKAQNGECQERITGTSKGGDRHYVHTRN